AAAAAAPAHEVAEEVLEHVREGAAEIGLPGAAPHAAGPHRAVDGGMAELVVGGLLLRVLEAIVGLVHLLEPALGFRVVLVPVGMQLARLGPVGLLDVLGRGLAAHAQNIVGVTLRRHSHRLCPRCPPGGRRALSPRSAASGPLSSAPAPRAGRSPACPPPGEPARTAGARGARAAADRARRPASPSPRSRFSAHRRARRPVCARDGAAKGRQEPPLPVAKRRRRPRPRTCPPSSSFRAPDQDALRSSSVTSVNSASTTPSSPGCPWPSPDCSAAAASACSL